MPDLPRHPLRLSDLARRKVTDFVLEPDAETRAAVAADLGIVAVRKLRLAGRLVPLGRTDWELSAELGATVVQDCVVTLAPVTTRLDEPVARRYLADMTPPDAGEVEMPEDDNAEPLPAEIDLGEVMIEALALALPPFPRADGAELAPVQVAAPGVAPLTDDEAKPFAGLGALRAKLSGEPPQEDG